jgi:hypothetical protein
LDPMAIHSAFPWRRLLSVLLVAALVACAWLAPLEGAANRQIDAGLKRALASFAVARTLNAIISVAQGTAVSLQPLGVGVNLTVGQVLDPVNDVIEQFSTLMLVASVAFGVQKVLVAIGAHWLVSLLLTVVAAFWVLALWQRRREHRLLAQALVLLLLIRFAVPLATLGSDVVFQRFMAADYSASQQVLAQAAVQVEQADPARGAEAGSPGVLERLKGWAGSQGTAWRDRLQSLKLAAEQATEKVIQLMVIFVLQTLLLPVGLLWLLFALARAVLRGEVPGRHRDDETSRP